MGCWNETCCITRLPIRQDQEVVMIDFYSKPNIGGFDHLNEMQVKRILKGTYDDYGSINELDDETKEKEHEENDKYWRIFILKTAWDQICKLYPRHFSQHELLAKSAAIMGARFDYLMDQGGHLNRLIDLFKGAGEFTAEYQSIIYFMGANRLTFDSTYTSGQDIDAVPHMDRINIIQKCFEEFNKWDEEWQDEEEKDWEDRDVYCFDKSGPRGWWSKSFAISQGMEYCDIDGIVTPEPPKEDES